MISALWIAGLALAAPPELWYEKPAAKWVEALPVGNGRLGAMVFGGTAAERIQFNDDTLWIGEPHDYTHPGAAEVLPEIRRLLFEGKQREAERLAGERFMSVPLRQMAYQPLADLDLESPGHEEVAGYRRSLDLDQAVARVRYSAKGVPFVREVFASYPADVIVVRIAAYVPGALTFAARLATPHAGASTRSAGAAEIALAGRMRSTHERMKLTFTDPLRFEARLRAIVEGGEARAFDDRIEVTGASAATLIIAAATSFRSHRDVSADPAARCAATMARAASTSYEALRAAHVAD
ncbi:MAG: glycoside hydrolase family 95 protein, partial [Planctomycetes bacterium]|nr:glycoside hydrolase family 95 protein [Planctomycetota bacterium]